MQCPFCPCHVTRRSVLGVTLQGQAGVLNALVVTRSDRPALPASFEKPVVLLLGTFPPRPPEPRSLACLPCVFSCCVVVFYGCRFFSQWHGLLRGGKVRPVSFSLFASPATGSSIVCARGAQRICRRSRDLGLWPAQHCAWCLGAGASWDSRPGTAFLVSGRHGRAAAPAERHPPSVRRVAVGGDAHFF